MCGSRGPVGTSNILESALPFDLSIFKSLLQIEVRGCPVRFKGTTLCHFSGWSWKSTYSARLFSRDWWMYNGDRFIFTSHLSSRLPVSLLLSSAQWMQLPADSGFVISQVQSGYSEHPPLNRDDDGIVRLLRRIALRVSCLLHWGVRCALTVCSPSWSLRRASCRIGNLREWSLTVLLQFSSPCGKTWPHWIWVTTASRPLTDPWCVTPIRLVFSF